jgi:hypothetical protein
MALFVSWGEVVRGREERALEVFNENVAMYGRAQADGRIESMDVCLLNPNGGGIDGFFLVHGSDEQLDAFKRSEDFMRAMADAALIVDEMNMVDAHTGEAVARQMGIYTDAIAKVSGKPLAAGAG